MKYHFVRGESKGYTVFLLLDERGKTLANGVPFTNPRKAGETLMRVVGSHIKSYESVSHLKPQKGCAKLVKLLVAIFLGEIEPSTELIIQKFPIDTHPWLSKKEAQIIKCLLKIPRGRVISYKSISRALGLNPRVIGRVMAKNPYPIAYPCHRVVYANGNLGGYLGSKSFINLKKEILIREGVIVQNYRVRKEFFTSF